MKHRPFYKKERRISQLLSWNVTGELFNYCGFRNVTEEFFNTIMNQEMLQKNSSTIMDPEGNKCWHFIGSEHQRKVPFKQYHMTEAKIVWNNNKWSVYCGRPCFSPIISFLTPLKSTSRFCQLYMKGGCSRVQTQSQSCCWIVRIPHFPIQSWLPRKWFSNIRCHRG